MKVGIIGAGTMGRFARGEPVVDGRIAAGPSALVDQSVAARSHHDLLRRRRAHSVQEHSQRRQDERSEQSVSQKTFSFHSS